MPHKQPETHKIIDLWGRSHMVAVNYF